MKYLVAAFLSLASFTASAQGYYTLHGNDVPSTAQTVSTTTAYGNKFRVKTPSWLVAVKVWRGKYITYLSASMKVEVVESSTGKVLASLEFPSNIFVEGWETKMLDSPVPLDYGTVYLLKVSPHVGTLMTAVNKLPKNDGLMVVEGSGFRTAPGNPTGPLSYTDGNKLYGVDVLLINGYVGTISAQ